MYWAALCFARNVIPAEHGAGSREEVGQILQERKPFFPRVRQGVGGWASRWLFFALFALTGRREHPVPSVLVGFLSLSLTV